MCYYVPKRDRIQYFYNHIRIIKNYKWNIMNLHVKQEEAEALNEEGRRNKEEQESDGR